MKFYIKYGLLLPGLLACLNVSAQNKVVVVPLLEETVAITHVSLAKTGNTVCSRFADPPGDWVAAVPCTSLANSLRGQDAELQFGTPVANRFLNNSDGTITDNVTRLVWLRNSYCAGVPVDWSTALAYVVELNNTGQMNSNDCADTSLANGHQSDWRLPNIKELQSLLNYGSHGSPFVADSPGSGQWSAGDPFVNLMTDVAYWSSTTYGFVLEDALRVNFHEGSVDWTNKTSMQHVWAVRSLE